MWNGKGSERAEEGGEHAVDKTKAFSGQLDHLQGMGKKEPTSPTGGGAAVIVSSGGMGGSGVGVSVREIEVQLANLARKKRVVAHRVSTLEREAALTREGAGLEKGGGGAAKGAGRRRERANHSGSLSVDHLASASDVGDHSPLQDPDSREKERDNRDSAISLTVASPLSLPPMNSPARVGSLPLPIPVMTRTQHLKTLAAKYDAKNPTPSSTQHSLAQDKADLKALEREESILLARKAARLDAGRRPTQLTDALALFGFNVGAVSRLPVQHRPQAHVQAAGSTEPHPCFEAHLRVALLRGTPLPTLPTFAALIRASDVYINREMDDAAYEFELMLEDAGLPSSLPNALSDLTLSSSPASTARASKSCKMPLDDPKYVADLELVKCAMAADALHSYSFCLEKMVHVDDAWHCSECGTCRDLDLAPDVWHCTKCNDCVEEMPCPKCLPGMADVSAHHVNLGKKKRGGSGGAKD